MENINNEIQFNNGDKYKLNSNKLFIVGTLHGNGIEVTSHENLFGTNNDFSSISEVLNKEGIYLSDNSTYPQKIRITRPFHVLVTENETDEKIHLLLDIECFESYNFHTSRLRGSVVMPQQTNKPVGDDEWAGKSSFNPHEILINSQLYGPHDVNFNETLSSELEENSGKVMMILDYL